jgi:hypothetical protein
MEQLSEFMYRLQITLNIPSILNVLIFMIVLISKNVLAFKNTDKVSFYIQNNDMCIPRENDSTIMANMLIVAEWGIREFLYFFYNFPLSFKLGQIKD